MLRPSLSFFSLSVLPALLFLSSCASYKPFNPTQVNYSFEVLQSDPNIRVFVNHDPYNGLNEKYMRRAKRKGVDVLAVKIENNSQRSYDFYKDFILSNGKASSATLLDYYGAANLTEWDVNTPLILSLFFNPSIFLALDYYLANTKLRSDLQKYSVSSIKLPPNSSWSGLLLARNYMNQPFLPVLKEKKEE